MGDVLDFTAPSDDECAREFSPIVVDLLAVVVLGAARDYSDALGEDGDGYRTAAATLIVAARAYGDAFREASS